MNVTYVHGVHFTDGKAIVTTDTIDVATTESVAYLTEKLEDAMDRIRYLENQVRVLEIR